MAKEYVPIYFDWLDATQDLTAEEKGNLIDAVVSYASGREYEHLLCGGCRIAFRFLKGQVDRNAAISDARAKAGANKGAKAEAENNKPEQNKTNANKPEQTPTNSPKEKEKEKEKDNKKENNISFARFWTAYPRKVNKPAAQRAFAKINPDDAMLETMLTAIEKQKASKQWQDAQYIPHPATWLNGRRWEDDLPAAKVVAAQDYPQRDYTDVGNELLDEQRKRIMARLEKGVG